MIVKMTPITPAQATPQPCMQILLGVKHVHLKGDQSASNTEGRNPNSRHRPRAPVSFVVSFTAIAPLYRRIERVVLNRSPWFAESIYCCEQYGYGMVARHGEGSRVWGHARDHGSPSWWPASGETPDTGFIDRPSYGTVSGRLRAIVW